MYRIDVSTALAVKPAYPAGGQGGFFAGCDGVNTFGTDLDHHWYNRVQEEIVNVILGAGIPLDPGDDSQMFAAITALIAAAMATINQDSGRLIGVRVFKASGTYNKNPDANYVESHCLGGGGGAGNSVGAASYQGFAQGGAGGGYSYKRIDNADLGATESVVVGDGGAGAPGPGVAANGGSGGTSSFGAHHSATGGTGGAGSSTVANNVNCLGGIGVGGDIDVRGGDGPFSVIALNNSFARGPGGGAGAGPFGGGGAPGWTNGSGVDGRDADPNSGAGGGSGVTVYNSAAARQAGGSGGSGLVVIMEYA